MEKLAKFWKSKKLVALGVSFVAVALTWYLNATKGLGLDANVLLGIIGLNGIYIFRQGSIDSKKTNQNAFKAFWDSRKFMAVLVGNFVPIVVGYLNQKYQLAITSEIIFGLLGLDGVYTMVQGAVDVKQPDAH